jgi:hypothetical protein
MSINFKGLFSNPSDKNSAIDRSIYERSLAGSDGNRFFATVSHPEKITGEAQYLDKLNHPERYTGEARYREKISRPEKGWFA